MKTTTTTRAIACALSAAVVGGLLWPQSADAADQSIPFYRNPVYGIGPGLKACESLSTGVPVGLWGNREPVEIDDDVSPNGRVLTQTGTRKDRTKDVYRFFLQEDECVATAGKAGAEPASTASATTFLNAHLGTPKATLERQVGGFSFCGNLDGSDMCTATNTLASPPPIAMADGDMPCVIGKDTVFNFSKDGRLAGVICEAFPASAAKIRSKMQATVGRGKTEVKQLMGLVSETTTWTSAGTTTTLVHHSGTNVRGAAVDSYTVSVDAAR